MKKHRHVIVGIVLSLNLVCAHAQPGPRRGGMGMGMGGPGGPQISEAMAKVFGDNASFTATIEMKPSSEAQSVTIVGKMAYDSGKSRFEMNFADAKGITLPPQAMEQMKAMGMDRTTMITRPDKKIRYAIYPALQAYAEMAMNDAETSKPASEFKVETAELGKETIDGHACVKKKVTVTDDKGTAHQFNVWSATDLKNFPVKIESGQEQDTTTMTFKDVKLGKPDAAQFDPPSDYKKYDSAQELMQQEMMKRMGGPGGMGGPPGGAGGPPRGQ